MKTKELKKCIYRYVNGKVVVDFIDVLTGKTTTKEYTKMQYAKSATTKFFNK